MLQSIRGRVFATSLLAISVVAIGVTFALLAFLRNSPLVERPALAALARVSRALGQLDPPPETDDAGELNAYVTRAARAYDVRIIVAGPDERVLADSDPAGDLAIKLDALSEAQGLGDTAFGLRFGRDRDASGRVWQYSVRALSDERVLAIAVPVNPRTALGLFLQDLAGPLLGAAAIGAVLALLLATWLSRSIGGPLSQMAVAAGRIAKGGRADGEHAQHAEVQEEVDHQADAAQAIEHVGPHAEMAVADVAPLDGASKTRVAAHGVILRRAS